MTKRAAIVIQFITFSNNNMGDEATDNNNCQLIPFPKYFKYFQNGFIVFI